MLNLSRKLGLMTGASVMGAVFMHAASRVLPTQAQAVTTGLHLTFGVAAVLIVLALVTAWTSRRRAAPTR